MCIFEVCAKSVPTSACDAPVPMEGPGALGTQMPCVLLLLPLD